MHLSQAQKKVGLANDASAYFHIIRRLGLAESGWR